MTSLFEPLRAQARALSPMRTAVVYPMSADSLSAAIEAAAAGYIEPVLLGPQAALRHALEAQGRRPDCCEIVDAGEDPLAASRTAALLARDGKVRALMKGSLHTDEFMSAILAHESGLRAARRLGHVFVLALPAATKFVLLTDAAVNIAPTLDEKADLARNAIDLCRSLGVDTPKVAVLAAAETVTASMPATLDAAALAKMCDRGQIRHAIVDGPLALDNAISAQAAKTKGLRSPVCGDADILLAPDIECGNVLYKAAVHFAGAEVAGLVLGATLPVLLTSRAESVQARLDSCVLARAWSQWCAAASRSH